jgi:2-oxoglutarate dehydrogenase complex dehydrogenase (E1) component-like enzyme
MGLAENVEQMGLGMSHRRHLNVMVNIVGKSGEREALTWLRHS